MTVNPLLLRQRVHAVVRAGGSHSDLASLETIAANLLDRDARRLGVPLARDLTSSLVISC